MMKKRVLILLAISAVTLWAAFRLAVPAGPKPPERALLPAGEAFAGVYWGATAEKAAAVSPLEPTEQADRFYTPKASEDPRRYRALSRKGYEFLGRPAEVVFVFFDDRMVGYHVIVSDTDAAALEREVGTYLLTKFGSDYDVPAEEGSLKGVWNGPEFIVSWWLLAEPFRISMAEKHTSVFGVVPRAFAYGS